MWISGCVLNCSCYGRLDRHALPCCNMIGPGGPASLADNEVEQNVVNVSRDCSQTFPNPMEYSKVSPNTFP